MSFLSLTLNPAIDCTLRVSGSIQTGGVHRVESETRIPGGKGVNVARVLAQNGREVIAGGLLGQSDAAEFDQTLRSSGVASAFMHIDGSVRCNLMIRDEDGRESKFNRPGYPGLSFDWKAFVAYVEPLIARVDCVLLCGSLPVLWPEDTYARLVTLIAGCGKISVLDTSGPALTQAVAAGADILKPNRAEWTELRGRPMFSESDLVEDACALVASRRAVIVSDGASGAYFFTPDQCLHAAAPKVMVADTTGAGDALLGQFCADAVSGGEVMLTERIAARAVAAGAACVECLGSGAPPVARMEALARSVQVRTLGI